MILCKTSKKKLKRAQRRVASMFWDATSEKRWRESHLVNWERRRLRALPAASGDTAHAWREGSVRLFSEMHRERTRIIVTNCS